MNGKKYESDKKKTEYERKKRELKEKYEEKWEFCDQVFPPTNGIEEYLGELDADLEWNNDKKGAYIKFLNIEAYKKFTENENLILMGRTGTGKSSILNRYEYAVNSGEISGLNIAISIRFAPFFDKLQLFIFDDNVNTFRYITDGIELLIKLEIVQSLVRLSKKDGFEFKQEIEQLSLYLKSKHIRENTDIIQKICDEIDFSNKPDDNLRDVIINLKTVYKDLKSEKVESALELIISQYKVIVLIDSLDYYDITEKRIVMINKALVEMAFSYYGKYKSNNILLKVAIPSEVYTHVIEQIAAKRKTKVVTIEWKYKDIIKMLAIKIFYYFKNKKYRFVEGFMDNYQIQDFYDYEIAVNFLHKMIPKVCHASIPVDFETLPYCIRHTQKKPRQIITIFNSFIEKICEEKDFEYFIYNSDAISLYIHRTQKDIINDALNMYNTIAKEKVLPIVKSVLDRKRIFLEVKDLNDAIKEALNIYSIVGLTEADIKQILIESGLLGQIIEERYVDENSNLFNNRNVIKICIALFEYQVKDTIPLKGEVKYVLHPMCYEYYVNEIDYNALVYPSPADDIEDNVLSKLEEEDVIF